VVGRRTDWIFDPNDPNAIQGINPADPQLNDLGFYDPAMALVVKGTSRTHFKVGSRPLRLNMGPVPGAPIGANLPGNDPKNPNKVGVAGAGIGADPNLKVALKPNGEPDPKQAWDQVLANGFTTPSRAIAVAAFLSELGLFDHATEFLKSALRQGVLARPWMFEAIAVGLEATNGSGEEIEKALLSTVDLEPSNTQGYLAGAKVMAKHNRWKAAVDFCRRSAEQSAGLPQPYLQALEYAEKGKDAQAMHWAASHLLGRDWPLHQQTIHERAEAHVGRLLTDLEKENRAADIQLLKQTLQTSAQRDLVVKLTWQGDADLDLKVGEPCGSECSFLFRQTPGGGTVLADLTAENHTETYRAAQAYAGEYKLTVNRVWGRPSGGKATLEIIRFKGTPQEHVERKTLELNRSQSLTVNLETGRRTRLEDVTPVEAIRHLDGEPAGEQAKTGLQQLQALANPVVVDDSGQIQLRLPRRDQANDLLGNDAVDHEGAFRAAVDPFFSNNQFAAQAVVSGDRRWVRLTFNPVFNLTFNNTPVATTPVVPGLPRPVFP
jgi:hypothetical protein